MKILCLGNNSYDTDNLVSLMAKEDNSTNHGLITDHSFIPVQPGYYHTTTVDIPVGTHVSLGKRFDKVILLDQPADQFTHWKILLTSYKILKELEKQNVITEYHNNENIKHIQYFENLVETNKSFCVYPFILMQQENNKVTPCPKSNREITKISAIKDWQKDELYNEIRNSMIKGEKVKGCEQCYFEESKNIVSTRQFETLDWISKLNVNTVKELQEYKQPKYYEVRLGNACNMACRMCIPAYSSIIDKEFKELNIILPQGAYDKSIGYSTTNHIDIESLDKKSRIYFTGGEPTVFNEFYEFMQKCIDAGKTDFDFCLGYNGQRLTDKMLSMFSHFSNMNFSFSIDGYGKINDYIRSYSDWDTVIKNAKTLRAEGHTISMETIPSIYNANNLHLLLEFFDSEFPDSVQFLQLEMQHPGRILSAFGHPDSESCARSLERVQKTQRYLTDGRGGRSIIDAMYKHYVNKPQIDINKLRLFYQFNDKLDKKRGTLLKDYLPELDAGRQFLK